MITEFTIEKREGMNGSVPFLYYIIRLGENLYYVRNSRDKGVETTENEGFAARFGEEKVALEHIVFLKKFFNDKGEFIYTLDEFLEIGMPHAEKIIKMKADSHRDENEYLRNFDLEHIDDIRDAFRNKLIDIFDNTDEITNKNVKDIIDLTIENMIEPGF